MEIFSINNNIIDIGNNTITISKSYNFLSPSFFINCNNKRIEIKNYKKINDTYIISFNIAKKSNIKLIIRDNKIEESEVLYFNTNNKPQISTDDIYIKYTYIKDKIFLNITKKKTNDIILNFEGDINKSIIWKKEQDELIVSFPFKINGFTNITYKLNGSIKKAKIYNLDDFPKNIIKIKNGIKLNKPCDFDLKLISETKNILIKKGTIIIDTNISFDETFKLFIDDYLLFEQKILSVNYLPILSVLEKPLRLKLSQPFYEDISVKFKNKKERWIIKQGNTELLLPYTGICKLLLEEVNNAIYEVESWIYHIK